MTKAVSSLSLADINTNTTTLAAARGTTGTHAALTLTAKETLRNIQPLKDVLGQDAKNFHLLLEKHVPEGETIAHNDDCPNSWNIAGLQAFNPRLDAVETLLKKTGIAPSQADGSSLTYTGTELKAMLTTLHAEQGLKR